jgi:hypothetical protein
MVVAVAGARGGVFIYSVATVMGLLFLVAISWRERAIRVTGVAILIALLGSAAFSRWSGAVERRYTAATSALILTVAACAIARLPRMRIAAAMIAAAAYSGYATWDATYGLANRVRSSSREAASLVSRMASPSDLIVLVPNSFAISMNYYLPPRGQQLNPPSQGRVERLDFRDWREERDADEIAWLEAELRVAALEGRRVWIVAWEPMLRSLPEDAKSNHAVTSQWEMTQTVMAAYDRHYQSVQRVRFTRSSEPAVVFLGEPRQNGS